jgi:hypothetical protein
MSAVTAEDQLFETGSMAGAPPPSPRKVPVHKTFRCYDQDQSFLMPPSLRDRLPEDHLAHFVCELVDEVLDLSPFLASYTGVRDYPRYDPGTPARLAQREADPIELGKPCGWAADASRSPAHHHADR